MTDVPDHHELSAEGLRHRWRDQWVLDGVDVSFGTGRTYAVVGPSGSGKTTLLSVIGGLVTPTHGRTRLDGGPVPRHVGSRPVFGWVPQQAGLVGGRTVRDNVAMGLLALGWRRRDAICAADAQLGRHGLDALAHRRAGVLSGGEAQRVAVQRALVATPVFVLADEPTGNLDRRATDELLDLLLEPRQEVGVVVVTHDPAVWERCDEVWDLRGGGDRTLGCGR